MLATPEMLAQHGETRSDQSAVEPGPFQDIPGSIWRIFLSAWATLFAMFVLFFAVNAAAAFVVTISALFAIMAFGLPSLMAALGRCEGHQCGDIIQTYTGPLTVAAAGVQIALIPIAAVIGLAAFIGLAL